MASGERYQLAEYIRIRGRMVNLAVINSLSAILWAMVGLPIFPWLFLALDVAMILAIAYASREIGEMRDRLDIVWDPFDEETADA